VPIGTGELRYPGPGYPGLSQVRRKTDRREAGTGKLCTEPEELRSRESW